MNLPITSAIPTGSNTNIAGQDVGVGQIIFGGTSLVNIGIGGLNLYL